MQYKCVKCYRATFFSSSSFIPYLWPMLIMILNDKRKERKKKRKIIGFCKKGIFFLKLHILCNNCFILSYQIKHKCNYAKTPKETMFLYICALKLTLFSIHLNTPDDGITCKNTNLFKCCFSYVFFLQSLTPNLD